MIMFMVWNAMNISTEQNDHEHEIKLISLHGPFYVINERVANHLKQVESEIQSIFKLRCLSQTQSKTNKN